MNKLVIRIIACLSITALIGATIGSVLAGGLVEYDFDADNFPDPPVIDNMYWPQVPGTVFTYFAETDDGCEWNVVDVTYDTDVINNVKVVVVLDLEWLDESDDCDEGDYDPADYDPGDPLDEDNFPPGELTEYTFDWYAQDKVNAPYVGGHIWYLGEETYSFDYDEDECDEVVDLGDPLGEACTDGSFEAGVDGAEAGLVMLADPSKGEFYQQEFDEDNAEDWGKALNFITLDDVECLKTKEWTPLERGEIEHKFYCPDDGQDLPGLYLIEEVSGGPKIQVELIDISTYDD